MTGYFKPSGKTHFAESTLLVLLGVSLQGSKRNEDKGNKVNRTYPYREF